MALRFRIGFGVGELDRRLGLWPEHEEGEAKALHLGLVSEINKQAIEEHFRDFVRYVSRRSAAGVEAGARVVRGRPRPSS